MKTLSLKILVCAATFALLTITRAQDDNGQQTPVENGGNQNGQPNVIIVPVPMDTGGNSSNSYNGAALPPADANGQPVQAAPPMQPGQSGQPFNPNMNRRYQQGQGRGFDRGQRRSNRESRDSSQLQPLSANTDASAYTPPAQTGTNGTDQLYLNFRNAPIDEILNYLTDACGFIIELDTPVRGTADVWSATPVSKDEAVQLLNSVLSRNGYALVREGRILRVMRYDDAIHAGIPVESSSDPDSIPQSAEVRTQIIPIRYVQARQLVTDLSPLISPTATILANDAGNSIVVTDSEENIHHLMEIIKDIDNGAEDVTEVQVFPLKYHDPTEVANLLNSVFSDQSNGQGNNAQTPIRFGGLGGGLGGGGFRRFFGGGAGGGGGGLGGFGGAGGAAGGNTQNDRIRQHARVVAVADPRTRSVLVTAPKDMMDDVQGLIDKVDKEAPTTPIVTVVNIENTDPMLVQKALQDFAASSSRSTQGNTQGNPLTMREQNNNPTSSTGVGTSSSGFGGGGGGFGGGGGGFGGGGGGFGGGGLGGGGGFRGGGQ